jgi:hypothetical protein
LENNLIDPITAITAATAAFNGVKKLVQAGREIEDVTGQIGKWFTAVSDFNHARSEAENPSSMKKFMSPKSVEQEALDIVIHKKKIQEMEAELATMIKWRYGGTVYEEMIAMRRKLRAQREQAVYAKLRRKKQIRDAIIAFAIAGIGLYLTWLIADTALKMHEKKNPPEEKYKVELPTSP